MVVISDPRIFCAGRRASTCFEHNRIGNKHGRWFMVFFRQIPAKEGKAAKVDGRFGSSPEVKTSRGHSFRLCTSYQAEGGEIRVSDFQLYIDNQNNNNFCTIRACF